MPTPRSESARPARQRRRPKPDEQSLLSYLLEGSALIVALLLLFILAGFRG